MQREHQLSPAPWVTDDEERSASLQEIFKGSTPSKASHSYAPLIDSLRLYAGWLLGWYFLLYVLSGYEFTRHLPFQIPLVNDLSTTDVVLDVTFGLFLFLLCTSAHRALGRHASHGVLLLLLGTLFWGLFVWFI